MVLGTGHFWTASNLLGSLQIPPSDTMCPKLVTWALKKSHLDGLSLGLCELQEVKVLRNPDIDNTKSDMARDCLIYLDDVTWSFLHPVTCIQSCFVSNI